MRSDTPIIDSFVKDSKLEDGDYLGLYLQAQRIEKQLNEANRKIKKLEKMLKKEQNES